MRTLEYETREVRTRDNDGDVHTSEITYAVVDGDTAGQEVTLRNGNAHVLRKGEVVVPAGGLYSDVFTAKDWDAMWSDSERVAEAEDDLTDVADDKESPADDSDPDADPAKDDKTTKSAPAKKAVSTRGNRS